jgi:hypothetical protein
LRQGVTVNNAREFQAETLPKNGPDAVEMGCLYYPRKQTSVSYAADCDVIARLQWSEADRQASSGGEVDTIFGFDKEADALEWIREKSQAWLLERSTK